MGTLVDSDGNPLSPPAETDRVAKSYRRLKRITVAALAAVATSAALISNFAVIKSYFASPAADLIIDKVNIEDNSYTPVIDVVIRNQGDRVATINEAIVVIDEIVTYPTVFGETGLTIDRAYDAVATIADDLPVKVSMTDVDRKVPADDVDKIRLQLRVETDFGMAFKHLCAYTVTLRFRFNGDQQIESKRQTVLNVYADDCFESLGNNAIPDKRKIEMLETYEKLRAMKGKRSSSYQKLLNSIAVKLDEVERMPTP